MRFRLVLIVFLISFATSTFGQEVASTTALRSKYVGAQGGLFADKLVSQSDICLSWQNGIFTCGWFSTGFNGIPGPDGRDYSDELDLIAGRAGKCGKLNCTADVQYFVVRGGDVANLNGKLGIRGAFAKVEAYTPVSKGGPRKGLIVSMGMEVDEVKIANKLQVSMGQWVKHDSGAFGFDRAWLYQSRVGLKLLVSKNWSVGVGAKFSKPFKETLDGRKGVTAGEFSFSYRSK